MTKDFFCLIDGKASGPFTAQEIKSMAERGALRPSDQIRKGDGRWVLAKEVPMLKFGTQDEQVEHPAKQVAPSAAPRIARVLVEVVEGEIHPATQQDKGLPGVEPQHLPAVIGLLSQLDTCLATIARCSRQKDSVGPPLIASPLGAGFGFVLSACILGVLIGDKQPEPSPEFASLVLAGMFGLALVGGLAAFFATRWITFNWNIATEKQTRTYLSQVVSQIQTAAPAFATLSEQLRNKAFVRNARDAYLLRQAPAVTAKPEAPPALYSSCTGIDAHIFKASGEFGFLATPTTFFFVVGPRSSKYYSNLQTAGIILFLLCCGGGVQFFLIWLWEKAAEPKRAAAMANLVHGRVDYLANNVSSFWALAIVIRAFTVNKVRIRFDPVTYTLYYNLGFITRRLLPRNEAEARQMLAFVEFASRFCGRL